MTIISKLNGIAARIAIAIILAILFGILMAVALSAGLNYYGPGQAHGSGAYRFIGSKSNLVFMNPEQNPMLLAGKIALIIRTVASTPQSERKRIAAAIAEPRLHVEYDAPQLSETVGQTDDPLDWLCRLIQVQLEDLTPPILLTARRWPAHAELGEHTPVTEVKAVVEAALPDGRRIAFTISDYPTATRYGLITLLFSLGVVVGLVSIWTARLLASPIKAFAHAAERLGVDLRAPRLAVRGPQELRSTIETFNRMQDRLRRFLEDRTQMLSAISHDLRSPLARLRFRAEMVTDAELQHRMFGDLETMNAMLDSTLAFARDDTRQEPRTLVDLGVLVGDVCEDIEDAGGRVSFDGGRGIDVPCRLTHVRRAVANIVENAIKYGFTALVQIARDGDRVLITVNDAGPGIPVEEHEKVFAPFYRLEPARDPTRAGVGLGLSIARTVAREHGGDVTLSNRDGGGLSVVIELPA